MQAIENQRTHSNKRMYIQKEKKGIAKRALPYRSLSLIYSNWTNKLTQQMSSTALPHHLQQIVASVLNLFGWYKSAYCSHMWLHLCTVNINTQSHRWQNCRTCCPTDAVLFSHPFAGWMCWNSIVCGLKQSKIADQPERFCIFGCMCESSWCCAAFAWTPCFLATWLCGGGESSADFSHCLVRSASCTQFSFWADSCWESVSLCYITSHTLIVQTLRMISVSMVLQICGA